MSNVVLILSTTQMNKMKGHYQTSLSDKMPPGSVFVAKPGQCTVTAYKSGKVLFQGASAEVEAKKWSSDAKAKAPAEKKRTSVTQHRYSPPAHISTMSIIGSDEVGTGDYFGPMTVVAVYAKKEQLALLKELGVQDSKNLKDPQIIDIAKQIKNVVPFSLLVCDNPKYNALQARGMSQGKMKALLHNQAIKHVIDKISPEQAEAVFIDQFAQPDVFFNYLKGQELFQAKHTYLSTKAEGIHLSVAAASILARYAFVKHFDKLSEKAGFKIPKGAGPAVDEAAARLIHEKGIDALNEFTKVHFANTEKAKALYRKKYQ
ncbi:ribonuclease HIII [Peribacillus huizhouensis]|uniref:Ribonuclease HIII n=1 Tax=Peribacillus huizhouensis TaxID=1501239 RepID=A0ABR6CLB1_9BACI|nr:ribonuclease HIII [Peribacillus huizhouensis]MBA9025820.1 ribonuclease HIII [Peribacillus huizhouensis]